MFSFKINILAWVAMLSAPCFMQAEEMIFPLTEDQEYITFDMALTPDQEEILTEFFGNEDENDVLLVVPTAAEPYHIQESEFPSFEPDPSHRDLYIVTLVDASAGGNEDLPKNERGKLDLESQEAQNYRSDLSDKQDALLSDHGLLGRETYRYSIALNGFAIALTKEEALALLDDEQVASVEYEQVMENGSNLTSAFLGLTDADIRNRLDPYGQFQGEDMVIGVIDAGFIPGHPSFSDQADPNLQTGGDVFGPPPAHFKGYCQDNAYGPNGEDLDPGWDPSMCNSKVIGARYFSAGWEAFHAGLLSNPPTFVAADPYAYSWPSPRSPESFSGGYQGTTHGQNVASMAVGRAGVEIDGDPNLLHSGAAPRARLAMYNFQYQAEDYTQSGFVPGQGVVQISSPGFSLGTMSDALAAIEAAIEDGVDVFNISWTAGRLLNRSINTSNFSRFYNFPIFGGAEPALDINDPFYGNAGVAIAKMTMAAEEAGIIPVIIAHNYGSGRQIGTDRGQEYGADGGQTTPPPWTITVGGTTVPQSISELDNFQTEAYLATSWGPGTFTHNIVKPDFSAPAVSVTVANNDGFTVVDGTSFAAPFVAGVAALLKEEFPHWSPARIRSALTTTADPDIISRTFSGDLLGDSPPQQVGAGLIRPNAARDPGLVYETGRRDYVAWACTDPARYGELITKPDFLIPLEEKILAKWPFLMPLFEEIFKEEDFKERYCKWLDFLGYDTENDYNLNLPMIGIDFTYQHGEDGVPILLEGDLVTVKRRVKNIGKRRATYVATTEGELDFTVSPRVLKLWPGQTKTYEVTIDASQFGPSDFPSLDPELPQWLNGAITWEDGKGHVVRTPVSARRPVLLDDTGLTSRTVFGDTFRADPVGEDLFTGIKVTSGYPSRVSVIDKNLGLVQPPVTVDEIQRVWDESSCAIDPPAEYIPYSTSSFAQAPSTADRNPDGTVKAFCFDYQIPTTADLPPDTFSVDVELDDFWDRGTSRRPGIAFVDANGMLDPNGTLGTILDSNGNPVTTNVVSIYKSILVGEYVEELDENGALVTVFQPEPIDGFFQVHGYCTGSSCIFRGFSGDLRGKVLRFIWHSGTRDYTRSTGFGSFGTQFIDYRDVNDPDSGQYSDAFTKEPPYFSLKLNANISAPVTNELVSIGFEDEFGNDLGDAVDLDILESAEMYFRWNLPLGADVTGNFRLRFETTTGQDDYIRETFHEVEIDQQ